MATIEERVVSMKFDNAAFQRGVAETLRSLESLNKGLQLQGATKGLQSVGAAASNQAGSIKNIEGHVQSLADRFKAMSVVATTALATIAHSAVNAGSSMLKSMTVGPIIKGFKEYETTLNSVQTIMANTGLEGSKGLATVTKALDELNHYSDQTIYNFSEMAKNIGTFTAAGVDLKTSTAAIKGIANLAAISGSNSEQASRAMYQLSQALSAGKVSLEDWNSVVQAGLGGKVFQNSLIETARLHGVAIDKMIKEEGSFRLTLQKGWLTSDILTATLAKFTGDLNAKQLKTMGYTQDQIREILKMGKVAQDAATKVKTMTQLADTLQEALGSGWSQTWKIIFGDFNEAKTLFTSVSDTLGKMIGDSADARNEMLKDWDKLGGRQALIDGIRNAWQALGSVLSPIRDAFREIFPATTAKQLYDMTVTFRDFMAGLKIGGQTAENLRRTFAGFFAILGIGWEIVKQVVKTIVGLFSEAGKGSGGFLSATASVGDFLVALHKAIKEGDGLAAFFRGLGAILAVPIKILKVLGNLLGDLFSGLDSGAAEKSIGNFAKKLNPLERMGQTISRIWNRLGDIIQGVAQRFGPLGDKIASVVSKISEEFGKLLEGLNFDDILAGINTGLFAGLVLMLRNLVGGGGAGGIMNNLTDALDNLSGALGAMQNTLRAATLLQIAIAVGILAVAMNTLAKIDKAGLTRASAAITVMFTQLLGALLIFEKFSTFAGFAKMPFVAASMILLAIAINVLASAVKKLSTLDWEELAKGLTGTAVLLGLVIATMKLMPPAPSMMLTAAGLIVLGAAIKVFASAVEDLSGLSWEEMAKGLVGVGALLASLALFTKFAAVNKGGLIQGVGILLLAAGIKVLASALEDLGNMGWEEIAKGLVAMGGGLAIMGAALYLIPPTSILSAAAVFVLAASLEMIGDALKSMGSMKWEEIGKGMVSLAGALTIIGLALTLIPPTSIASAAAILIVASALGMIADAFEQMGGMSWMEISKGLVVLAGSLLVISAAMIAMTGALPGAAALMVVAAALTVLTPVLTTLGNMSWGEIIKGLFALAGVFLVLGVAGLVLGGLVPVLIGLGVAITLLGVGVMAAGAGVFLFAAGLTALAAAGAAGAAAIVAIVVGLAGTIPVVMKKIGEGIIAFAKVIEKGAPAIVKAIVAVLDSLIDAIVEMTPKIVDGLLKMLDKMLDSLQKYVPKMVDKGMKLIIGILEGINKNIDKLVDTATELVVRFIKAMERNQPKIIQVGVDFIISFVNGIANAIRNNSERMGQAGGNLATAIIEGMVNGLKGGVGSVIAAAKNMAKSALDSAMKTLGVNSPSKEFEKIGKFVNEGFVKGLKGKSRENVSKAFDDLKAMLKDMRKAANDNVSDASKALNKLTSARKKDVDAIIKAMNALRKARAEQALSIKMYNTMMGRIRAHEKQMEGLAAQYDAVTEKLTEAQSKLQDAIQTRDDFNKSVTDNFSDLPAISEETTLEQYLESLKKEVAETQEFAEIIQRLRDLGLNDRLYEDLLEQGTTALPFMRELIAAGKYAVDQVNALDGRLLTLAGNLGKKASTELYQAGVDAATGLVKGLEAQQKALEDTMTKLADAMIAALNKALEAGLPKTNQLTGAIGDSIKNMQQNKPQSGNIPGGPQNIPKIPKDSWNMGGGSIGDSIGNMKVGVSGNSKVEQTIFNQYNSSPKALSSAELYRQTKNQLSAAKK